MSEAASAVRLAIDGFKQVLQSGERKRVGRSTPECKGKGVCERDLPATLNRGSGGQGQPNIGIV